MADRPLLPDLLLDCPAHRRLAREREDAEYLKTAALVHTASAASLERDRNTWGGTGIFVPKDFRPHQPGEPVDVVICARMDLDHPQYFPDNLFAECADCGCDLQHRPDAPPAPRLCICCAARRVREAPDA